MIQTPASKANPILRRFNASNKFQPNPLAPIKDEITAIDKQTIMTWLTPIRMSLLAVGINTLSVNCKSLHPLIFPASITSGDTALNPKTVSSIIGGVATIIVTRAPA